MRRPETRHGDVPKALERIGAINPGRVIELIGNALQACEIDDHLKAIGLPGGQKDDREHRPVGVAEPVDRLDAAAGKKADHLVKWPRRILEQRSPNDADDDHRGDCRQEEQATEEIAERQLLVEQQCGGEGKTTLHGQDPEGEARDVPERGPEQIVLKMRRKLVSPISGPASVAAPVAGWSFAVQKDRRNGTTRKIVSRATAGASMPISWNRRALSLRRAGRVATAVAGSAGCCRVMISSSSENSSLPIGCRGRAALVPRGRMRALLLFVEGRVAVVFFDVLVDLLGRGGQSGFDVAPLKISSTAHEGRGDDRIGRMRRPCDRGLRCCSKATAIGPPLA